MNDQFKRPQTDNSTGASMPDKGTKTGVTDTYGANISGSATNGMSGGASGDFMMPIKPGGGCNDGR